MFVDCSFSITLQTIAKDYSHNKCEIALWLDNYSSNINIDKLYLHIKYDPRLKISPSGIKKEQSLFLSQYIQEDNDTIFLKLDNINSNVIAKGYCNLWSISFELPEDVNSGDVFYIQFVPDEKDMFTLKGYENDTTVQDYVFQSFMDGYISIDKIPTTTAKITTTRIKTTTTTTTSSKSKTNTTTAIQQSTTTIRTLPTLENDYDTFILLDFESGKYTIPFDSTGLTYKSTNPQVATVSNTGIITPVSVGTATITATNSKGKTATFSISVVQIATLTPKITTTVTTKKLTSTTTTSKPSTTTSTSQTTTNTTTTMPSPVKYELGDINNDSKINAVDASTVLSYYAMVSTNKDGGLDDNQKAAADVNHDGSINAVDASIILSYYAYISTKEKINFNEYIKTV